MEAGGLGFDTTRRQVRLNGAPLSLTATEFRLLEYLMARPGVVFSRDQLLNSVLGGRTAAITDQRRRTSTPPAAFSQKIRARTHRARR